MVKAVPHHFMTLVWFAIINGREVVLARGVDEIQSGQLLVL